MVNQSSESRQTQAFSNAYETVLPQHYRLVEMVGRGGMAEVFLGEDTRLGRKVAIKFLNAEFRRDPDRVRRFRQEARSASALNHPNILTIHDIGDHNGVQFIVSEFVEGETLGTRIAQGRLPLAETIEIAMQIASALSASHAAGIVHRDIKPDNVMIRRDGVVKVLDFGLAKARGFTTSNGADFDAMTLDSGSTSPGLIVGTPQYMSPEQARGKELDGRTDIFSLGILIFEMITRNSPFDTGSFADTMAAILTKEPKRLEEFIDDPPVRLVDLVSKCLKKDRDQRFSSMAEIIRELKLLKGEEVPNSVITGEVSVIDTGQTQAVPTHRHSIRSFLSSGIRERTPVTAIILVAAVLLVGGWWAWDRVSFRSSAPSLMRTVPITSWSSSASELVTSASFSPDGNLVAFAMRKGDATEIWVKPVVGGDPVQVTKTGGYNQYPVWSPDGQQIAFLSNLGDSLGLWRIPFTGGSPTRVVKGLGPSVRLVRWGKGGALYYQSVREFFKVVDQGEPTSVSDFTGLAVRTIAVSPDEQRIAYSLKTDDGWTINVRDLSGGSDKEIARTREQIDYLAWHPNSSELFASFLVEGSLQVFEVPTNGAAAKQRSNGDMNFVVHDVSANGSVLYGALAETSDLWRVDTRDNRESIVANDVASEFWPDVFADGSIAYQSVSRVEQPEAGSIKVKQSGSGTEVILASPNGMQPIWSQNGRWLAFLRHREARTELWKVRADGLDSTRITEVPVNLSGFYMAPYLRRTIGDLAWSPDDSHLAFPAQQNGESRLWIVPADGSTGGKAVDNDPGLEVGPLWTNDGNGVVFLSIIGASPQSADRAYRVLVAESSNGRTRTVHETKEPLRILGLTDGGKSIVIASNPNKLTGTPVAESIDIYTVSIATGQVKQRPALRSVYHYNIHLSKSGDMLAFVSREDDRTVISSISLVGSGRKDHLVINDPKILISSLGLSRDGSFIVYGKQTRTNLLSMLTN